MRGGVVVSAGPDGASELLDGLRAAAEDEVRLVSATAFSALRRDYRDAAIAVVAEGRAAGGAALSRRTSRVPWIAAPPTQAVEVGAAWPAWAAAIVVPRRLVALAAAAWPDARLVALEDRERLSALVGDLALAEGARGEGGSRLTAALADGWTFANGRATRLAIRLMPVTGKAPRPIHPKHLIPPPPNGHWYLQYIHRTDRVLDLGCANGAHSIRASRVAASVLGVDVDAAQLTEARARTNEAEVSNVRFVRGDLTDPATIQSLSERSFDVIMALDVLEHLNDRVVLLEQLRRLLAPGGRLLAAVPNRDTRYRRLLRRMGGFAYVDPDHKIEYTEAELVDEIARSGMQIAHMERAVLDSAFSGFATLVAPFSLTLYGSIVERRRRLARRRRDDLMAFLVVLVPGDGVRGT